MARRGRQVNASSGAGLPAEATIADPEEAGSVRKPVGTERYIRFMRR
ncbi:MAG TPA: hypothetical protein VN033_02220 [Vulgatibacter sp.]|nr:hypothetical protein [Vulgatibacter sp.]